jgi:acyl-CoA thioesterase-2
VTSNDRILELLDLGRRGRDEFVAPTPSDGPGRLFGGQVASQSLRAATLTVPADRLPHSLHAYFIRPGRPASRSASRWTARGTAARSRPGG